MSGNDFQAHLACIRAESAARKAALGDMSQGGILKQATSERWAFVLPDVSEPGKWRIQYFDTRGFSGHSVYNTADECVDSALASGFALRDDQALDRAQQLASFWRGNYAADLIQRINSGAMTHAQGDALLSMYDLAPP